VKRVRIRRIPWLGAGETRESTVRVTSHD
jgi:hypothetical protein